MLRLTFALSAGLALGVLTPRLAAPLRSVGSGSLGAEAPSRDCRRIHRATEACEVELAAVDPTAAAGPALDLPDAPTEDRWAEVFADCGAPAQLVDTECREVPCVGVARLEPGSTVEDLREALDACGVFEALEDGTDPVGVVSWPVTCPGDAEETMVVVADTRELLDAGASLLPEESPVLAAYYGVGLLGVRAATLAARWPCGAPQP